MHFSTCMYKESLHNCIVESILTLIGGDCERALMLTPSGSGSEDVANFCFFIYRLQ